MDKNRGSADMVGRSTIGQSGGNPATSMYALNAAQDIFCRAGLDIILCTDPMRKTRFLGMLAGMAQGPVLYMDTDLLYAGGVRAGLVDVRDHITVATPDQDTWHDDLADAISASSSQKMTVVVDSLNGVYGMTSGPDTAMTANSHIAALATLAAHSGSSVIVGAVAKERKGGTGGAQGSSSTRWQQGEDVAHDISENMQDGGDPGSSTDATQGSAVVSYCCRMLARWVVSPGGRQVPRITGSGAYLLLDGTLDGAPLLAGIP